MVRTSINAKTPNLPHSQRLLGYWVNNSVHFSTKKSTHFINCADLEAAQLINYIIELNTDTCELELGLSQPEMYVSAIVWNCHFCTDNLSRYHCQKGHFLFRQSLQSHPGNLSTYVPAKFRHIRCILLLSIA